MSISNNHADIRSLLPPSCHKAITHRKTAIKILHLLNFIIDGIIHSQLKPLEPSECQYNEIRIVTLLLKETHSIKNELSKKYFINYLQNKKSQIAQKTQHFLAQKKWVKPTNLTEFLKENELILLINIIDQYIFVSTFLEKMYRTDKMLTKYYKNLLPILSNQVIIHVSTDISNQKKSEKNLQIAKKQAEASNRAKTEFLENMRHDIRTPLTGMIGFAQLIQNAATDARIKEYADNLVLATSALLDFQNSILDAIKSAKDITPITPENCDLTIITGKVFDLLRPKAIIKNLTLSCTIEKNVPTFVYTDGKRLFRIILELVTNALKFTAQGKIHLHLIATKQTQDQFILECSVSDTGVGIADEQQEDIFDRFHRLSPSSDGVYEGTGLGLTLVNKYIKDLNGKINVKSKLNVGTVFTCIIPMSISTETKSIINTQNTETILFHQLCILLIEDHLMTATVTHLMLKELGCIVDIAPDAQTAYACMTEKQYETYYDLIFLDLGLPDMDGFALAKKIRTINASIPIIALTAHCEDDHQTRFTDCGIHAIFQKPLLKSTAIQLLNHYCSGNTMKPIIDLSLGAKRIQKSEADAKMIIELLLKNIADDKKEMEQVIQKKAWHELRNLNHKLLGGLAYCGAPRLEAACQQLQVAFKTADEKQIMTNSHAVLSEITALQSHYKL